MSIPLYQNPIWLRISQWGEEKPTEICIRETSGRSISYHDLVNRVNAVAVDLVKGGFAKGDKAFFLARPSIESVVYFLAVLRAGGVIVAADIAMGREAFRSRFELVQPKWLILEPVLYWIQQAPLLETLLRALGVEVPDTGKPKAVRKVRVCTSHSLVVASDIKEIAMDNSEDAVIVFTSGTTAMPKGVVHTYSSILATLNLINDDLKPMESDVFYASQMYFLFIAFLTGATAVLPRHQKFKAGVFANNLTTFAVTKAYALPAECEDLIAFYARHGGTMSPGLKSLMLGSAPVLSGFLSRLRKVVAANTEVLAIYGSTEILPISRVSMSEKLAFTGKGDLLGTPFSSVQVRIDNDEIVVNGPNLCRTYFGSEPLKEYRTGDLGAIDESGRIILLGRKKDMIIKGNFNIYPTLFESVIAGIYGVKQCALVGIYRENKSDEEIVLVVETDAAEPEDQFRARLKRELASGPHSIDTYAQPDRIVFMDLPLSGRSRKVDKNLLREKVRAL
jgi:acyl-coenzyme A synthetase/AMP-(fatty) acid ligase